MSAKIWLPSKYEQILIVKECLSQARVKSHTIIVLTKTLTFWQQIQEEITPQGFVYGPKREKHGPSYLLLQSQFAP